MSQDSRVKFEAVVTESIQETELNCELQSNQTWFNIRVPCRKVNLTFMRHDA